MLSKGLAYLAAGLSVALLVACVAAWILLGQRDALLIDLDRAKADAAAADSSVRHCRRANEGWQTTLDTVQGALKQCVAQRDDAAAAGERAVAAARDVAHKAATDATLWRKRFELARTDTNCRNALEATLCPSLSDY